MEGGNDALRPLRHPSLAAPPVALPQTAPHRRAPRPPPPSLRSSPLALMSAPQAVMVALQCDSSCCSVPAVCCRRSAPCLASCLAPLPLRQRQRHAGAPPKKTINTHTEVHLQCCAASAPGSRWNACGATLSTEDRCLPGCVPPSVRAPSTTCRAVSSNLGRPPPGWGQPRFLWFGSDRVGFGQIWAGLDQT